MPRAPHMAPRLNMTPLLVALDTRRVADGLTWRQVASQSGVSASTLSRLQVGKVPDLTTFAGLLRWLKLPAEPFLDLSPPSAGVSPLSVLLGGQPVTAEQAALLANLVEAARRLASALGAPGDGASPG